MTRRCDHCACWFTTALSGGDLELVRGSPSAGVCKEGPRSVPKDKADFCMRFRLAEERVS